MLITAVPITKLFAGGGGVEDMCNERRRAEACVNESAHRALMNAGMRDCVKGGGEEVGERERERAGRVRLYYSLGY